MSRIATLFTALGFALAGARPLAADTSQPPARPSNISMAARIDELLAAAWAREGIEPAPPAGDLEFLRRASLDLAGVIPAVAEVRAFATDPDPGKRSRLVDRLLASHLHAEHLATTWRNMMVPRGASADGFDGQAGLQSWLRSQFLKNQRYDQMVADLLVATGVSREGPGLFYTAFDLKPEELAANTARVFLGIQIECAQCHDHPFDRWTQQDFWGYAAFFARLGRQGGNRPGQENMRLVDKSDGEVMLPGTQTIVLPLYPRGDRPDASDVGSRRMQLGIWMVSRDNPFLARAAVNRAWAFMFGRGLVEPVDDIGEHNRASHPQLFNELAAWFVDTGFDLRNLLRVLASTRAYQLSSRLASGEPPRPELFDRMPVKSLTPEQFYDSLMRSSLAAAADESRLARGLDARRQAFVAKMQAQRASRLEYDAGVAQVLQLLNGGEVLAATGEATSGLLAALAAPVFNDRERVEIVFLATVSRPPDEQELIRALAHLADARSGDSGENQALGDILWALVNTAEFALNH
jgi:hypothetical protein